MTKQEWVIEIDKHFFIYHYKAKPFRAKNELPSTFRTSGIAFSYGGAIRKAVNEIDGIENVKK